MLKALIVSLIQVFLKVLGLSVGHGALCAGVSNPVFFAGMSVVVMFPDSLGQGGHCHGRRPRDVVSGGVGRQELFALLHDLELGAKVLHGAWAPLGAGEQDYLVTWSLCHY